MSEEKKPNPQELEGDGLGDGEGAEVVEETRTDVTQELEQARAEIAELSSRLLRAQADFENFRRRTQREKEDLSLYANQRLLLNLLPVLDNLERALATQQVAGDEKLRQGVELTARSFRDILSREGVTALEAAGQPFDPNLHEAVMTVDSPDHEDDTVVMEFEKGYRLGDRVIRPSKVQVCKKS